MIFNTRLGLLSVGQNIEYWLFHYFVEFQSNIWMIFGQFIDKISIEFGNEIFVHGFIYGVSTKPDF